MGPRGPALGFEETPRSSSVDVCLRGLLPPLGWRLIIHLYLPAQALLSQAEHVASLCVSHRQGTKPALV